MTRFLFALSIFLFFACGTPETEHFPETAPSPTKEMQLPDNDGPFLVNQDSVGSFINIGLGFSEHEPSDSVILYLDGQEYPLAALDNYVGKKLTLFHPMTPNQVWCSLRIDERLPFQHVADLLEELRYLGAVRLFWVQKNGRSIPNRKPGLSNNHYAYYQRKTTPYRPTDEPKWIFPNLADSIKVFVPKAPNNEDEFILDIPKARKRLKRENTRYFEVDGEGKLLFEDTELETPIFIDSLAAFIKDRNTNAISMFFCGNGVTYKDYMNGYAAVHQAYQKVWDAAALDMYGKRFGQLSKEEYKKIKERYPFVVMEETQNDRDFQTVKN